MRSCRPIRSGCACRRRTSARAGKPRRFFPFGSRLARRAGVLISIVCELVTSYAIDGIHWDFIRYEDTDAGYPADRTYARSGLARFGAATGRTDVPMANGDAAWEIFADARSTSWCAEAEPKSRRQEQSAQPISHTAAVAGWARATNFETPAHTICFRTGRCGCGRAARWRLPDDLPEGARGRRAQPVSQLVDAPSVARQRHMYIGQCSVLNTMDNSIVSDALRVRSGRERDDQFPTEKRPTTISTVRRK